MKAHTNPFLVFPWDTDFLAGLKKLVMQTTGNRPGNCTLVFPHGRPGRYLVDMFRNDAAIPKPCLLPRILTVSELFAALRAEAEQRPPVSAGLLDRVGLLLQVVTELALPGSDLCLRLAQGGQRHFFPWGVRLAALMEECFTQDREPDDMLHTEGQVAPFGGALLASLGRIHQRYTEALDQRGWTTPGYDAFRAARLVSGTPDLLAGRTVLIAGFAALTGTEEKLFRHLWSSCDARICLHTDPAVADLGRTKAHWTCEDHIKWITAWRATATLAAQPSGQKPRLTFVQGYDLHSQLEELGRELAPAADGQPAIDNSSTAVILPHTGLLMPVLHHVPAKDVNISMGYPLARSPLARLLETIIHLQETRRESGYHWRQSIDLIRHPYLKMLELDGERPLRDIFHRMEDGLRTGSRYASLPALADAALAHAGADEPVAALVHTVLTRTLTQWEQAVTPASVATAVGSLCELLLDYGGDLWQRFPIDAECLFRLIQRVIPALRECELANTPFPPDVLFTILRETIKAERVPFEADPIGGLQVMGMLESRLLRFRRVLVLDATDDRLPGAPANDPLLPDSLRAQVGLPDARRRERVAAYTFHRLLAGAEEAVLLWQEGLDRTGLLDDKKARSRFVEELLWREEKNHRTLFRPGQGPVRAVTCGVRPFRPADRSVAKTPAILARLNTFLASPVSPSRLDAYLTCPLRFHFEQLCRLAPPEEVNEGDDPAAVGTLLHEVLRDFYAPHRNIPLHRSNLRAEDLQALFLRSLAESDLAKRLPPDSYLMLEVAGPVRLQRYLQNQPDTTLISHLEAYFTADMHIGAPTPVQLGGRLDRVDTRNGAAHILDYKTGSVRRPSAAFWKDDDLWAAIANWSPDTPPENDPLFRLSDALKSVQLPAYIHLYATATGEEVHDAAWVELRETGEEKALFGLRCPDDLREAAITQQTPLLLNFLLRHMREAPAFLPRRGNHCDWCSCSNMCRM